MRAEVGASAKEGSISFLKKRNKKLLIMVRLSALRRLWSLTKNILLACAVASLSTARAQTSATTLTGFGLERLMAELARVSSASAQFTERKTMQVLTTPMLTSGTLTYIAPDHIQKTTLTPATERFVLDRDDVSITGGPNNQTERYSLAKAPQIAGLVAGIRATLAGDLATLERYYVVQLAGMNSAWRLNLLPRSAASAHFVKLISILGSQDRISEIDTESPNGDHSEMTVSENARDAK
jgi:outer membrane lipoprotein-sorting protein